jgi:hypothetical protein
MTTHDESNLQRRKEDRLPEATIDWSKPGAPAVAQSSTAGAAKGGNTCAESEAYAEADFRKSLEPIPPLTAPAPITAQPLPQPWRQYVARAYVEWREHDHTTPDDVLDLMRDILYAAEKSAAPAPQQSESTDTLGAKLHDTMDAKVWADEFCRLNNAADNGMMLAWFANAIMVGYDFAKREVAKAAPAAPVQTAELADVIKAKVDEIKASGVQLWGYRPTDEQRYRRLRILGAAPGGSKQLEGGTVLCFQNLDDYLDADIAAHPSRGEFRDVAAPVQAEQEVPSNLEVLTAEAKLYRDLTGDAMKLGYDGIPAALEALRAVQAEQAQAEVDIDTPEFMDLLSKFAHEASCEQYDEAEYKAARKAIIDHIKAAYAAVPAQAEQVAAVRAKVLAEVDDVVSEVMREADDNSESAEGIGAFRCLKAIRALAKEAAVEAPSDTETIVVDRVALRQVLEALTGPSHLIRELQVTVGSVLFENPITKLVEQYNATIADQQSAQGDTGGDHA